MVGTVNGLAHPVNIFPELQNLRFVVAVDIQLEHDAALRARNLPDNVAHFFFRASLFLMEIPLTRRRALPKRMLCHRFLLGFIQTTDNNPTVLRP